LSASVPPTIGLVVSARVFEEVFARLGISRDAYVETYDNDWIAYYSRFLAREGFRLRWYVFARDVTAAESRAHVPTGAEVRFLPAGRLYNWWTARLPWIHHFSLHLATMSWALVQELRHRRPDVLYVQDYESGRFDVVSVLGVALGIPVIGQFHGGHSPARWPLKGLRRWALGRATFLLAPNRTEHGRVRATHRLADRQALHVPNPVEVFEIASGEAAAAAAGIPAGHRYLLFVGRLDANKSADVLVAAFRSLGDDFPDLHLVIVGVGPQLEMVRVAAEGIPRVHLLGWIGSRERVRGLLGGAYAVVCPSREEAFPYVVLEAMAAGRPVVASDVNGTRDQIIDGLTGCLVPPGDIPALRGALAALVKDPERAAAMGRAGRERVEREFSAPVVVPRLVDLLNRAIARGRRR